MYSTADLHLFVRTADCGSLTRAARMLHQSPAAASAALRRLEQRLGVLLFARSTRSLRLTPDGEIFLEYCRDALASLAEGEALLMAGKDKIRGQLSLSAPSDLGRQVLLPWLNHFQEIHPDLKLSLQFADRVIDLRRDPVDIALRYGRLDDSSLVSQHVAANRRVIVASPDYLARHGTPRTLHELSEHNCLLYYLSPGLFNTWRFNAGKEPLEIKVRGDRMADDGGIVREWAVAGIGIAYKSWLDVWPDLKRGTLVTILDDYAGEDTPLNAVCPHRNSISPAVRALVAFLREKFERQRDATGTGGAASD
ncbi:LysR family transcriptional regulator [Noviherbaspirillum aerium]|uniref:LysR family transcriptional regulator n=1 Tax=Noviherbaspirillum aerium TaxID=2588497 RepID=UPI00124C2D8C|nr:LysR family transcriptional regulator [Noviherbaspirillum aerium]